jgi:hypothetical protein
MKTIDFDTLLQHDTTLRLTPRTLSLWKHIFDYVVEYGYADTTDNEAFIEYVQQQQDISIETIARHLRRMAAARLLQSHVLIRKRGHRSTTISVILGSLPTRLVRYTLPGAEPSLRLERSEQSDNEIRTLWDSITKNLEELGPPWNGK